MKITVRELKKLVKEETGDQLAEIITVLASSVDQLEIIEHTATTTLAAAHIPELFRKKLRMAIKLLHECQTDVNPVIQVYESKSLKQALQLEYDYDQSQELLKNSERAKQGRRGYEGHADYAKRCPNCDGMNFHQFGNQRVCADCDYTIEESKNEFGGQSGNPFASSGRTRARELTQHGPSQEAQDYSVCPECGSDNAVALVINHREGTQQGRCDDCGAKWDETERRDSEFNKRMPDDARDQAADEEMSTRPVKYTGEWSDIP